MKWSNDHNLPEALASAIRNDTYRHVGDISVTELINPPQYVALRKIYDSEIVEDVSDHLWMLLGSSVHAILERSDTRNVLQEERLVTEVLGWQVSGKPDLFDADGKVTDYKFTSVWTYRFDARRAEWTAQMNMYAHLLRAYGFDVKALEIVLLLRDWRNGEAEKQADYPPEQVTYPVELWPADQAKAYLEHRVRLHQEARQRTVQTLQPCTAEERWARPTKFAVMKPGGKKAFRVCDTEADAQVIAQEIEGGTVVCRPGGYARCEGYCVVAPFCEQYQRELEVAAVKEDQANG